MKYLTRNRKAFAAIVLNSAMISLMILSVFWKIAAFPDLYGIIENDGKSAAQTAYTTYLTNITGLAFMISNQLSISASINVIMQVPLQAPVMSRELANKMYSPTAYYLGRYLSNIIIQLLYPMIMILILYWNIDI